MTRRIIQIDEEKCTGCGICAEACHEGAIGLVNGKAKLLRDDYCDGLGDCLPTCPTGAIRFVEREAAAYDEAAVKKNRQNGQGEKLPCSCPGTDSKTLRRESGREDRSEAAGENKSRLTQWPVQIKLVPVNAPYFEEANLLVAADCTAYAYGDFHREFMEGRITLVGCPKLDAVNYADKLTQIFANNDIQDILLTRMEVPCCGGMEFAVKKAIEASGKDIPLKVVTIGVEGNILS
jgi:NAD-dependent dihydropyrimidine dehydrogenase PreA subunit